MFYPSALLCMIAGCFLHGYGVTRYVYAAVADPAACPKYQCKNTHAYWSAGEPNTVYAYYKPDGITSDVQSEINIFTPDSDRKLPQNPSGVNVKKRTHATCTPHCGKDNATPPKWQSPQTVSPVGAATDAGTEIAQTICTDAGGIGPLAGDQSNGNPDGKIPPMPKD